MQVNRVVWACALVMLGLVAQLSARPPSGGSKEFETIKAQADKGDAEALLKLAALYTAGDGVPKDPVRAAKLHHKAAELGLARAQCLVGMDYASGEGVKTDRAEAVRWFRKAADQGMAGAKYNLGVLYGSGAVQGKTAVDAAALFRKAAEQGLPEAEHALAECYFDGVGVPKDLSEGMKWIRQAAERGYASAQNTLGLCYTKGKGVKQDYVEAYKWLNLASAQEDPNSAEFRVNLAAAERFMTPEQIAEGQRRARQFKPGSSSELQEALSRVAAADVPVSVQTNLPESAPATANTSKTGFINVKADDESEEIFVDSAFVGNTPAKLKLSPGPHVVEVKKPGFKTYRKEISVAEGSELTLRVVLEKQ